MEDHFTTTIIERRIDYRALELKRSTVLPLLIHHVIGAKPANYKLFTIFPKEIEFLVCLVSGRVSGFTQKSEKCNTYLLDDSTAYIEMIVFKDYLERMIKQSFRFVQHYYRPEFVGPLCDMIKSAERIRNTDDIKIGTPLLVLGHVTISRSGKNAIVPRHMFVHKRANRDMDIAFKDYLISCCSKDYKCGVEEEEEGVVIELEDEEEEAVIELEDEEEGAVIQLEDEEEGVVIELEDEEEGVIIKLEDEDEEEGEDIL